MGKKDNNYWKRKLNNTIRNQVIDKQKLSITSPLEIKECISCKRVVALNKHKICMRCAFGIEEDN